MTWKGEPDSLDDAVASVAEIVFKTFPDADKKDNITITISYGFDIGIAFFWRWYPVSLSPAEWESRLNRENVRDQKPQGSIAGQVYTNEELNFSIRYPASWTSN